jgi:hypothetical protein
MRYPFCTDIRDERLGIVTIYDFECDVEVSHDPRTGWSVDAVYVGNADLYAGDEISRRIAADVSEAALSDLQSRAGRFWERAAEDARGY